MEFRYMHSGSVGFFDLAGGLTVGANLDDLHLAIGAISDIRVRRIVLDLGRTTQLDCAGMGQLIRMRGLVMAAGRTFGLVNVDSRQRRLLELARLDAVLDVRDNITDALQRVSPASGRGASEITRSAFRVPRESRSAISTAQARIALQS